MESWSYQKIYHSGDAYFEALINDVRNAQHSITIESYIFSIDHLTRELFEALSEARDRGVSIKIVVDGFGSYYSIPDLDRLCSRQKFEFRVFHPLPYPLLWARELFTKYSLQRSLLFKNINRRTHRKITIIDEKRAYLGSLNFTQDHCEKWRGILAWRDTGVAVEGDAVKTLVLAFHITYFRTFFKDISQWMGRWKPLSDPHESLLRLNTTPKARRRLYRHLLQSLHRAEKRVYITTAYFLPKRSLLRALLKAAQRGVDVRIITPGKSDVPMVKWAAFYIIRYLLQNKVRIFEYQKTILHAKTMMIDDVSYIGSFNLNHRSILHDLEVVAIFRDAESLENMEQQWEIDIQDSRPALQSEFSAPPFFLRWAYSLAFRLRYLM